MRSSFNALLQWAGVAFAALMVLAAPAHAQISLGTAGNFGVLGGSTVTNTGASTVNGNVGVSPGTSVTGFPRESSSAEPSTPTMRSRCRRRAT